MSTVTPIYQGQLTSIARDINHEHDQAENKAREAIQHALNAGALLVEAKGQVRHGGWADWLAANFHGSKRTAQAYMRLANNRDTIEAKTQSSAHLSVDGALKLLAAPSTDKEVSTMTLPSKLSWLPDDDETVAELHFRKAGHLFVQMAPGKANAKNESLFDVALIGDSEMRFNSRAAPGWWATFDVMRFTAGLTSESGELMELRKPPFESDELSSFPSLLNHMGWKNTKMSPGFVAGLVEDRRRWCELKRYASGDENAA